MTGADLESRIRALEEKAALERLINTYHKRADAFDWDGWAQTFTDDSVFEFAAFGEMRGPAEILRICKANMHDVYDEMQHIMVNLDFEVNGDEATGTANLIFTGIFDAAKPAEYFQFGGRYKWRFARGPRGWRIAHTLLEILWTAGIDQGAVFAGPQ